MFRLKKGRGGALSIFFLTALSVVVNSSQAEETEGQRQGSQEGTPGAWLAEEASLKPLESNYTESIGPPTVTVKPAKGMRLVLVQFKLKALGADPRAVDKLADRRKQIQASISDKTLGGAIARRDVILSEEIREKLTGAYRMFDMKSCVLVDPAGGRHEAVWSVDPLLGVTIFSVSGEVTGASRTQDDEHWHGILRADRVFVGLLDVGLPVNVSFLYSIPNAVGLEDLKLVVGGERPITVKGK